MNGETNAVATNNTATQTAQTNVGQNVSVDYDKMAEALDKRSNGFMKTYLKEQGLSENEMNQAIKDFKASKTQKEAEAQTHVKDVEGKLEEALTSNKKLQIENSAYSLVNELGIDQKTIPYLIKMGEFGECFDEKGGIVQDKVKEALNKVLTDIPGLKKETKEETKKITIGADSSNSAQPDGNIFGFNFTGVRKTLKERID